MVSFYTIRKTEQRQYRHLTFATPLVCSCNIVCMGINGVHKFFKDQNLTPTSGMCAESKHIVDPMDNSCEVWYEYEAVNAKLYQ